MAEKLTRWQKMTPEQRALKNQKSREYDHSHPEQAAQRRKKHQQIHPEAQAQYHKEHREKHRDQINQKSKEYRKTIAGRITQIRSKAQSREIEWHLSDDQKTGELLMQPCFHCGKKNRPEGIDRIDSTKGYEYKNCVPSCKRCNCAKNDMSNSEWSEWKARFIAFQSQPRYTFDDSCGI